MAEILEKIAPGGKGRAARFRVRCACGRVYVTNGYKGELLARKGCAACRTFTSEASRRGLAKFLSNCRARHIRNAIHLLEGAGYTVIAPATPQEGGRGPT